MRIDRLTDHAVHITLSERNLRALLAKLDGHPPDSVCTIGRWQRPDETTPIDAYV